MEHYIALVQFTDVEITVEMERRVFHASMLDRFKRNGWPLGQGEVMYWNVIGGPHREEIINSHLLPKVETDDGPREAVLASYSNLKKPDMVAWMKFILHHQDGTIDWEDGMLFKDVRDDCPQTAKRRRLWFKKLVSSARNESGLENQPGFDEESAARQEILSLLADGAQNEDLGPQVSNGAARADNFSMADPPNGRGPNTTSSIDNPANPIGPTDSTDPITPAPPPKKVKSKKNAPKKTAPPVEELPNEPRIANNGPNAANSTNLTDPSSDPTGPTGPKTRGRGRPKGAAKGTPTKGQQQQNQVAAPTVGAAVGATATTPSSTSKGQKKVTKPGKENETPNEEQSSLNVEGRQLRNRADTTTTKDLKRKGSQLESEKTKVPRNAKNGRKTK